MSIMNNRPSERLMGYAPVTVFAGIERSSPIFAIIHEKQVIKVKETADIQMKVKELVNGLEKLRTMIVNEIKKQHDRDKNGRKHTKDLDISIGDYVLFSKSQPSKIASKWRGPYKVINILGEHSYMIKNPLNEEEHVVHSSRLLFYDKGRELTKKEKDELAFVDNGDKFEVESLKEVSKEGEEYRMLVEWKGYSMEDASWGSVTNLIEDVPILVRKYVKQHQNDRIVKDLLKKYKGLITLGLKKKSPLVSSR
jgi:hypothetical protein